MKVHLRSWHKSVNGINDILRQLVGSFIKKDICKIPLTIFALPRISQNTFPYPTLNINTQEVSSLNFGHAEGRYLSLNKETTEILSLPNPFVRIVLLGGQGRVFCRDTSSPKIFQIHNNITLMLQVEKGLE